MKHPSTEEIFALNKGNLPEDKQTLLMAHLKECADCDRQFREIQLFERDLRSMELPEMNPGFALQVAYQVKKRETSRIFEKGIFKVFRWVLLGSSLIALLAILHQARPLVVTLPALSFPGMEGMLLAAFCVGAIWLVDRVLTSKEVKKM